MSERDKNRDELFEQFGNKKLPDELKRVVESDDDLMREWEELQSLEAELPTEDDFKLSDPELDELCEGVGKILDGANVTPVTASRSISPVWQRSIAFAATLALVAISSLIFNQYQSTEEIASVDTPIDLTFGANSDEAVDLSDPMSDALLLNYTNRVDVEPVSMLLDDLTEEEFEYLSENFNVDELML